MEGKKVARIRRRECKLRTTLSGGLETVEGKKGSGTGSGRPMESEGSTGMGDLLGSPRVAPLLFAGLPNNVMLLFARWLMHDRATRASRASPGALDVPFDTHVFGDNQPLGKATQPGGGEVGARK